MKRSEMVRVMLETYSLCSMGGWSEATDEERFQEILTSMEICGMRPPCKADFGGHGHFNTKGDCDDYIESCDNNWEPENET